MTLFPGKGVKMLLCKCNECMDITKIFLFWFGFNSLVYNKTSKLLSMSIMIILKYAVSQNILNFSKYSFYFSLLLITKNIHPF